MLNLLVRTTAFCILLNMCLPLPYPTTPSYLILSLSPFEYPPRVSVTIIINQWVLYFKTWILSLELHSQWGIF